MPEMLKQRVEILAQRVDDLEATGGGGSTGDAYTKAESDAKFLSKTDAASSYQPKGSYATTSDIASAVGTAIADLDVSSTAATGHYVKSIAQENGLIVPVVDTVVDTAISGSTHPITSGAVYSLVGDINSVLEEVL